MTTLTVQDEKRLDVIQRVYRSELTVVQAALVMGVSEWQCYRVKAIYTNCHSAFWTDRELTLEEQSINCPFSSQWGAVQITPPLSFSDFFPVYGA